MHTDVSAAPDEREEEHELDRWTAERILDAAARSRRVMKMAGRAAYRQLAAIGALREDQCDEERFLGAVGDLLDDWIDSDKIALAEEVLDA